MIRYVVGFSFTEDVDKVLLIEKNRPAWQVGYHNGVGGKIEENETPYDAMCREGMEEAGLSVEWVYRGVMKGWTYQDDPFECHIFSAHDNSILAFEQKEDEIIKVFDYPLPESVPIVANLNFLVPLCATRYSNMRIQLIYDREK